MIKKYSGGWLHKRGVKKKKKEKKSPRLHLPARARGGYQLVALLRAESPIHTFNRST